MTLEVLPRPPAVPPEENSRRVLAILAGELTVAEAARKAKVSEQSVSNWKRLFLEAGRERQLLDELEEVKAALGETTVEMRVWERAAEGLPPWRTSR